MYCVMQSVSHVHNIKALETNNCGVLLKLHAPIQTYRFQLNACIALLSHDLKQTQKPTRKIEKNNKIVKDRERYDCDIDITKLGYVLLLRGRVPLIDNKHGFLGYFDPKIIFARL